jgi:hypothetical protein
LISTKFELEKLRAQVEREQKENQNKDYVLRDHADLVKANQQLTLDKNDLVARINNLQESLDKVAKVE